jgi:hypothetical protein
METLGNWNGVSIMTIDPKLKKHMEDMWTATEINGVKIKERHLGFGALPDIKFIMEDGSFLSAKALFNE